MVGLPVHLSGKEGQKAAEARAFAAWLTQTTGLPVQFWDERFTTVEAESALWEAGLTHKKRKARRDKVAAQILLAGVPRRRLSGRRRRGAAGRVIEEHQPEAQARVGTLSLACASGW